MDSGTPDRNRDGLDSENNQPHLAAIRRRLAEAGLDGYLAFTAANVLYSTGFSSYFIREFYQLHGTVMAIIPADNRLTPGILVGDMELPAARQSGTGSETVGFTTWIESRSLEVLREPMTATHSISRSSQWDWKELNSTLHGLLSSRSLDRGRIGTDLYNMRLTSFELMRAELPEIEWVDFSSHMYEMRALKLPAEVDALRRAVQLSEVGMESLRIEVREGDASMDVRHRYMKAVANGALSDPALLESDGAWIMPTVGLGTMPGAAGIRPGSLLKLDCGTRVAGYCSDGGRTFVYGKAAPDLKDLYAVLQEAHFQARALMRPGIAMCEVYEAAQKHIRTHGFPNFTRGHYGHSVGLETYEEPPFISVDERGQLQPGMVLAIETPFYLGERGAIQIEDLVAITDSGHEVLHHMSHDLVQIGH